MQTLTRKELKARGLNPEDFKQYRKTKIINTNCQQLPKAREYMDCLIPRPGHVFIQMDVDALEAVVLAELSEDPACMQLYAPESEQYTLAELDVLGIEYNIEGDQVDIKGL